MQSALDLLQPQSCSSPDALVRVRAGGRSLFCQESFLTQAGETMSPLEKISGSRFKVAMSEILVVDDEPLIAMMLADWLKDEGHIVVGPAHSLEQAGEIMARERITAAILDVSLGEQQSFALAAELQERKIPFAFATGHSAKSVPAEFQHVATISKPFDFEIVRRIVASFDTNGHKG